MTVFAGIDNVEFGIDTDGPVISDIVPAPDSVSQDVAVPVSFTATDEILDVGNTEIYAGFTGYGPLLVYKNGVTYNDFFINVVDTEHGAQFSNILPGSGSWEYDADVEISVVVNDTAGNTTMKKWRFETVSLTTTASWSFTTGEFLIVPPALTASSKPDGSIALSWDILPKKDMRWHHVEIYRSEVEPPAFPPATPPIYIGTEQMFTDIHVTVGKKYFYTVFADINGFGSMIPYDPASSDSARSRIIRVHANIDREYSPVPGDFGANPSLPVDSALIIDSWGRFLGDRDQDFTDTIKPKGKNLLAPITGLMSKKSNSSIVISGENGVTISISGCLVTKDAGPVSSGSVIGTVGPTGKITMQIKKHDLIIDNQKFYAVVGGR